MMTKLLTKFKYTFLITEVEQETLEEINDREEDLHVLSDITGELKLKEYCNNQVIDETTPVRYSYLFIRKRENSQKVINSVVTH